MLSGTPAPHGAERAAAHALVHWGVRAWPALDWDVDEHGQAGANVVVSTPSDGPPALLLASHLDTSLSGHPAADEPITGRSDTPAGLQRDDDELSGPGLAVARGPAAAALAALVTIGPLARPVHLLLAGSGTHRSTLPSPAGGPVVPSSSAGALHHLATRARPDAVLVAKCGPRTPLTVEPGACYLRLTVTGGSGAALAPSSADPAGGVLLHAGSVLASVARWRAGFVCARRGRADGVGGEVGVGALSAGLLDKPDLLPARLDVRVYVITVPGDDPAELAAGLARQVRTDLAGGPLAGCAVAVQADPLHPAAGTPEQAPVVRAARAAWTRHLPPAQELQDWTGSSDAVVFRAAGLDTVRLGPTATLDPADRRRDRLSLAELTQVARVYAEVARALA